MTENDKATPDGAGPVPEPRVKPRPELTGHDPAKAGEAVEPEATQSLSSSAVKAGDRMWGPPGPPNARG